MRSLASSGSLDSVLGIGDQGLQTSCKLGDRQIGQVSGPSPSDQGLYLGGELPESALGAGQVGRKPGAAAVDGCMAPRGGLVGGGSDCSMQSRWLRLGCLPQGQRSLAGAAVAAVADARREAAEEAPGSRRERASQLVEGNSKDGGIEDGQGGRDTVEKAERLHPGTHGLREAQAAVCDDLVEADGRLGQRVVGQGVSGVEGCLGSVGCGDRPGSKGPGPGRRCLGDGKAAQADEVFQLGLGLAERLIVEAGEPISSKSLRGRRRSRDSQQPGLGFIDADTPRCAPRVQRRGPVDKNLAAADEGLLGAGHVRLGDAAGDRQGTGQVGGQPAPGSGAVVNVEDQVGQPHPVEPVQDRVDGRPFLRDEQDALAACRQGRDQVGDRLRFSGPRRAIDDQVGAADAAVNGIGLAGISVQDEELICGRHKVRLIQSHIRVARTHRITSSLIAGDRADQLGTEQGIGGRLQIQNHAQLGIRKVAHHNPRRH